MSALLVVHRSDTTLEREAVARLVTVLRRHGHSVQSTHERAGLGGSEIVGFERDAERADHILLVDPIRWWTRGPATDAWEAALRERLELCVANEIAQFVVVREDRHQTLALDNLLAALPAFELPSSWAELLEHVARPRAAVVSVQTRALLRRPQPWIDRPALDEAIDQAIAAAPSRAIWIRGGIGTGKSCSLISLLARREAEGLSSFVHVVRSSFAVSVRPSALLARLAPGLGDLRELPSTPDAPTMIVIDGLEQLLAPTHDPPLAAERRRFAASLAGPLPPGLTCIVASRPLPPGSLGEREPDIDLDAPRFAAEQRALVEALLANEQLRELAGSNPAVARALSKLRKPEHDEIEVPPSFAALLERAFVRLRDLPTDARRELFEGLALLRVAFAPLPRRLLRAAGSSQLPQRLESFASEWLRIDADGIALAHPLLARFLATELDSEDIGPHVAMLAGLERLRSRGELDEASQAYAHSYAQRHRQATRGLSRHERALRDLAQLEAAAKDSSIEARLEHALATARPEHSSLVAAMLASARRHASTIAEDPKSLATHLWTDLVAQGFSPADLDAEFVWTDARPRIRLQNRLDRLDRSHRILAGHTDRVEGCALTEDGSLAITVSPDATLRVWDPRAGRQLRCIEIGGWGEACALTPDGALAATTSYAKVLLFDPRSGAKLGEHKEHTATVTAIAISPNGQRVISGDRNGVVVIWDRDRDRRQHFDLHSERINTCVITRDGTLAATGGQDEKIVVWSLDTMSFHESLLGHSYGIGGLAFTRDGKRLVSICIGEARVWDARDGREIERFDELGHSCAGAVVVADDRQVLSAESDERVLRWDLDTGELIVRHIGHPLDMRCIAATPDGETYLSGGDDRVARVWRRSDMAEGELAKIVLPASAIVPGEPPDSVWISNGQGTRLLALDDQRTLVEFDDQSNGLALAWFEDRVYLAKHREIVVYAAETGRQLGNWPAHGDWLRCVAVDPERRVIACGSDDGMVYLHDLDGAELRCFAGHTDWVHAVAFTPAGRVVSVDADGKLLVWKRDAEKPVLEIQSKVASIYALALDSAGKRAVVAGLGGGMELCDLDDGQRLHQFAGHTDTIRSVALGFEDRLLASVGSDHTLRLWSLADGRELARLDVTIPLNRVSFVGERLVAGDVIGNLWSFEIDRSVIAGA